jgi:hypothetical protein
MFAWATLVPRKSHPRFDPAKSLETIQAERITVCQDNPEDDVAMLEAADDYEGDFAWLRACISGRAFT